MHPRQSRTRTQGGKMKKTIKLVAETIIVGLFLVVMYFACTLGCIALNGAKACGV